jgi:DNA repair exonuclease SbcCD ATPase subunit
MKHIFLFAIPVFMGFAARAQQPVKVEVTTENLSKGNQMAISVVVPESKPKQVISEWDRYVNKRSIGERLDNFGTQIGNIFRSEDNKVNRAKLRMQKKGNEYAIQALSEPMISKHTLDIYAKVNPTVDGCRLSAFFQYSDSVFMNESNIDQERLETIKSYVYDFAVQAYKSVVDDQIRDARKELSKQEKIARKITKSTRNAEKSIAAYESDIQQYQAEIPGIQNDIKRVDDIIETKKPSFSQMTKSSPGYEEMKASMADFQKDKSKNYKKIKALNKKIKARKTDIRSARRTIDRNEQRIVQQQRIIAEKELAVKQLEQKKENIR